MNEENTNNAELSAPNIEMKTERIIMDSCRVCMSTNTVMTNIFDKDNCIVDRILFCTGIQFLKEENAPQSICVRCLSDLSIAHRFKTLCIQANTSLRNWTNTVIKTEENNDDDCNDNEELGVELNDESLKEENGLDSINDSKLDIAVDDGKADLMEPEKNTKQTKRTPFKKNVKLKLKKDQQPKVRKKAIPKKKQQPDHPADSTLGAGARRPRCAPCGLAFDSRADADAHKETAHKGETQYWVCEICGQRFAHRGSLSTHTRSHFPPAYPCSQCTYRAAHKYDLIKHQRIHAGDRPYQCDACPATFYDASNMNSHIRRNHQKQMNFRCEMCGRGFFDRSKLNRHVDSHNNIKRHSCAQCHAAFTRLSYLRTHMLKRHGVELPALCPGPQRRHLLVDLPPVEYVKPSLIAVKQDATPS